MVLLVLFSRSKAIIAVSVVTGLTVTITLSGLAGSITERIDIKIAKIVLKNVDIIFVFMVVIDFMFSMCYASCVETIDLKSESRDYR